MSFDLAIFKHKLVETPLQVRFAGALMLILGLFIIAAGGAMFALTMGVPFPISFLPDSIRVDAQPGAGEISLGAKVFTGLLTVFGGVSMVQGLWQLVSGRKNKTLLRILIVMAVIFVIAGLVASTILCRKFGTLHA